MTAKMGRPTDDPKRHETRIRMTDEDVRILETCSRELGKTKTDIIRMGIREVYKKVNSKHSERM